VELRDVFKGRWLVLVIVLPAALAVIAGSLYLGSAPSSYEARSIISIREVAVSYGANQTAALIDDFGSAMESLRVEGAVADAEGVDEASGSIEVSAVGNGADVRVTYRAPTEERALAGLEAGTREALLIMVESELRSAQRRLASSESVAAETTVLMQELEGEAGGVGLTDEVARRSADILALRNQIAASEGQAAQAALIQVLEAKVAELQTVGTYLLPWEEARARFDNALQSEAQASLDVANLRAFQDENVSGDVLRSPQVVELSQLPGLLRTVTAAGLGAAIVIVVAALASTFSRRRYEPDEPGPSEDPSNGHRHRDVELFDAAITEGPAPRQRTTTRR
jgi:hypothetical protein